MLTSLLAGVAPWLGLSQTSTWQLANGSQPIGNGEGDISQRGGVILRREQLRVVLFNGKAPASDEDAYGLSC